MRSVSRLRLVKALAAMAVGSTCFQIGGCGVFSGVTNFLGNFNPCGAILNCDPVQYRFLTSGYEGPGVNADIDPACTYPPFCIDDPFVGGAVGDP